MIISGLSLRTINANINVAAGASGISVNILLIFLLLSARIPEFKNYNRLILQIAFIDIADSVIMVIIMPIGIIIEGREFFLQNGCLQFIQQPWNHFGILIWQFFHFFSLSAVPVQFVYRYLLLCKNKTITNSLYASFFVVPFLLSFAQIIIAHFTIYPNLNLPTEILQQLLQYFDTTNSKEILIGTGGEHSVTEMMTFNMSSTAIIIISYSITYYCGYKIKAHFKASSLSLSPKTAQMQQSLNRVLFFQALTAIIFLIIPSSLFVLVSMFKLNSHPIFNIFLTATSWPPFVNATFALITLKPLRRKFFNYFETIAKRSFKLITRTSSSNLNTPQILSHNLH